MVSLVRKSGAGKPGNFPYSRTEKFKPFRCRLYHKIRAVFCSMVSLSPSERSDSHRNHAMNDSLMRVRCIEVSETLRCVFEDVMYHGSRAYHIGL